MDSALDDLRIIPHEDGAVEAAMLQMAQADTICSVGCTHCGALNSFSRFSAVEALPNALEYCQSKEKPLSHDN